MTSSARRRAISLFRARGTWAFVDQGVVSLGTFATAVFLARNLDPTEYGLFVVLFSVLLFLNGIHSSLVIYPLSVQGAQLDENDLRSYAVDMLLVSLLLSSFLSIVLFVVGVVIGDVAIAISSGFALVGAQFQEVMRRTMMSHLRYRDAIPGDTISYLGQAATILLLAYVHEISLARVMVVLGGTSLISSMIQAYQLHVALRTSGKAAQLIRNSWSLGRWMLGGSVVSLLSIQAFPWAVAAFSGAAEVARYQAVGNLLGSVHPIMLGLGSLVIPSVSMEVSASGVRSAQKLGARYSVAACLFLLPYFFVLSLWPTRILGLVYGSGSVYASQGLLLRAFVILYVATFLAQAAANILGGMKRSDLVFAGQMAGAISALFLGLPLTASFGAMGAVSGATIAAATRFISNARMLWKTKVCQEFELERGSGFAVD